MGYQTEFNWVLKLKPEQGLEGVALSEGRSFNFSKSGSRIYPIGFPIDLVDDNWDALALVKVDYAYQLERKTMGGARVLKVYEGEEKRVLTEHYRDVARIMASSHTQGSEIPH
jgi:hypothetical protein